MKYNLNKIIYYNILSKYNFSTIIEFLIYKKILYNFRRINFIIVKRSIKYKSLSYKYAILL